MIKDIFHPGKAIFVEIAKQLRKGKLPEYLPKGILLYGPSGTGKNAMIEALVNESGCLIFSIGATELVTNIQGSGSSSTKEIFVRARRANPNRGVIILINELQSITPVTTDQSTPLAHTRSGQEYDNALTQLCIEYDQCSNNDNILIAVTCNEFFRINERIRSRFECIKFPCPDENGIYEILKNKSEYFGILLSYEEIERYVEKLNGLSGRDITHFVQNAKREISLGKTKEEALALAMQHQIRAARDARENSNRRFNQLRDEAIRGAVFGASGTITKALVVSVLAGIGFLGLVLSDNKDNGNKGTSPSHK